MTSHGNDDEPHEYSSPACSMHEFDLAGERSNSRVDAASRIIAASPAALYRAHLDPQALMSWLPPKGMKGRIEEFDPRVGGTYRMVLTYEQPGHAAEGKTTEHSDTVAGRFVELIQDKLIAQVVQFDSDDPAFAGEMKITWAFTPVSGGTHVMVRCENVPSGIRPEDHQVGLASSLENLAQYCE
ncbi:MAG TPA: SRPBCC family protein [Steroidobacter sp.]|uniref:SRPBCC family protein n=1 Tax=Steroidobacter sp. TaxID=1978227 RepID=UPI002ED972E9